MMPQHEVIQKFFEFTGALSVLAGAMAWWTKGSPEQDAVISEAADTIISAATDADLRNKIELHTGKAIGDQLTVEEAIELNRDREWHRFERRN